jgi:hypothetical protein
VQHVDAGGELEGLADQVEGRAAADAAIGSLPPDGYGILFLASSTIITGPLMVKNVG